MINVKTKENYNLWIIGKSKFDTRYVTKRNEINEPTKMETVGGLVFNGMSNLGLLQTILVGCLGFMAYQPL